MSYQSLRCIHPLSTWVSFGGCQHQAWKTEGGHGNEVYLGWLCTEDDEPCLEKAWKCWSDHLHKRFLWSHWQNYSIKDSETILRRKQLPIRNVFMKAEDKFPSSRDFRALLGKPENKVRLQAFLQNEFQRTAATTEVICCVVGSYAKNPTTGDGLSELVCLYIGLCFQAEADTAMFAIYIVSLGQTTTEQQSYWTQRTLTTKCKRHVLLSRRRASCAWKANKNWLMPNVNVVRRCLKPSSNLLQAKGDRDVKYHVVTKLSFFYLINFHIFQDGGHKHTFNYQVGIKTLQ